MIIVKISSGLGNQLFQYAFGRAISIQGNSVLKLDVSFYLENSKCKYSLDNFNIKSEIATDFDVSLLKNRIITSGIKFKIKRRLNFKGIEFFSKTYIAEKTLKGFEPKVFKYSDNTYFEGYWGNENYFKKYQKQLRKDITLKEKIYGEYYSFFQSIKHSNAISIHIRRGDYLSNQFFGVLPLNYYYNAMDYISSQISNPVFYLFSDDIDWIKQNFNTSYKLHFVSNVANNLDYIELILMSECQHNIIGNSTFSWWGAWLNNNPNKIVIAPSKWYSNEKAQAIYQKSDFIPKVWKKI